MNFCAIFGKIPLNLLTDLGEYATMKTEEIGKIRYKNEGGAEMIEKILSTLLTAFLVLGPSGTTVAVGFYEKITCSDANKWTEDFYTYFLAGYTVEESVSYACGRRSNSSGLKSAEICGSGSYRLGQ